MTVSAQDHPHLASLLGDPEVARHFSARAEVSAMLAFEAALARAQAAEGVVPAEAADAITEAAASLAVPDAVLAAGAARDGLIVPALVTALKAAVDPRHIAHVHRGATSQDVIDTGLMLRLATVTEILGSRLASLCRTLDDRIAVQGDRPLMGRTRMQVALPVTLGHRFGQWRAGFAEAAQRLGELTPRLGVVQLGGAVGTRAGYGAAADAIERRLAADLGLSVAEAGPWHTNRARLVEFGDVLGRITGAAGKLGQDVVLMAQNETGEARLLSAGGSSVMAHKRNPVKAEVMVTLARFAPGLVGTLHHALVHENERSGSAWTLEWLVLPQLAVTAGASLRLAAEVLAETEF
jgi:3-carboxy-cis,cis-muconate cycloisomerase